MASSLLEPPSLYEAELLLVRVAGIETSIADAGWLRADDLDTLAALVARARARS